MTLKRALKKIYPLVAFFSSPRSYPKPFLTLVAIFIGLFASLVSFHLIVLKDLPSPSQLSTQSLPLTTHIRDRNGKLLYKIYRTQNRTLVSLKDLPLHLIQAVLAIEDKNFYNHKGFSLSGIARSLGKNLKCVAQNFLFHTNTACSIQGGSTITQQLVKTSLLSPERTVQRKLKELVLSIAVESIYSKDQILDMYLNRVPFGGAAYGIEEAAFAYFGKPAKDLNLSQSAMLAGLPASPTSYSPFGAHPELAKLRQLEVLRQMVAAKYISWEQAETASASDLTFQSPATDINAPHFVMYIKDLLAQKYGSEIVESGGLEVTTTLDLSLQEFAEKTVATEINKLSRLKVGNGAVLITKPATGEILAMVGSKNYFDLKNDGNVNVTLAKRQPGSSIKPLNYALALQSGFTAASIIDDSPITYRFAGQPSYSPVNYDGKYHGRVTLRTALASSYNIPAVKILASLGVEHLIGFGEKLGITTWDDPQRFGLSLTLGGGEIKMTELAAAYGVFANYGNKVALNPLLEVKDRYGRVLEKLSCEKTIFNPLKPDSSSPPSPHCSRNEVIDPRIAFLITDILADNQARSPTFGLNSQLYFKDKQVAVKTGTTNSLRDNWTIGYTPDFLVAVWVGNNDNSPMSYIASGITGASPIWRSLTAELLKIYPNAKFTPPDGLVKATICPLTGQLACAWCAGKTEYFIFGTQPKTACVESVIQNITQPNENMRRINFRNPEHDTLLDGAWTIRP